MEQKEILEKWINAFNNVDVQVLGELYAADAVNHQVQRSNYRQGCHKADVCRRIPKGINGMLRGCGFFYTEEDKIILQRGYWDKLSFLKLHHLSEYILFFRLLINKINAV